MALEERLPRLELLRTRMLIGAVLVLCCALAFGLVSWAYLAHGGGWS